jgi:hypothetical protein
VTAAQLQVSVIDSQGTCTECHYTGCAVADCGGLDLDTQAKTLATVNRASTYAGTGTLKQVAPNNLRNSSLWLKVLGGCRGPSGENVQSAMPLGKEPLSSEKMELIKNWICSGAL